MNTDTPPPDGIVLLCLNRDTPSMGDAVTMGQGYPSTYNDLPCYYKWCPALEIGKSYTHPDGAYTVDASPKNVSTIEKSARRMIANKVEIPYVTDHKVSARNNLGYMRDTRRRNGWMEVLLQILGDDSLNVARKNKISLGIKPKLKDSQGNEYDMGIEHVASTPVPLVNGQTGLLAASRGADGQQPIYLLSAAASMEQRMKPEHKKRMLACLSAAGTDGVSESMPDDELMSRFIDQHEKQMSDLKPAGAMRSALMKMSRTASESIEDIVTRYVDNEQQVMTLSRSAPTLDPELAHERQLRMKDRATLLIQHGWTPADANKIAEKLIGPAGTPNLFALSRAEGSADCYAAELLDTLLECRPAPKTGELPGKFLLSRENVATGAPPAATEKKVSPYTGKEIEVATPVN